MNHYERSKSSLFMMELLLNLLLFCVLCGGTLMFFIKSNDMTQNTTDLHNAVRITTSIASIYESGDGTLDTLRDVYGDSKVENSSVIIYFNNTYAPCPYDEHIYEVVVKKVPASTGKITIQFYNEKNELIYSIDTIHYTPSTLADVKEVP